MAKDQAPPASRAAGALSPKAVRYVHTILHKAVKDAMRWGVVARNVADVADPPKQGIGREMTTWSADEKRQFLDVAKQERLYPAFHLASSTGMRKGEVLGIRWEDVDFEAGRAAVVQTLITVANQPTFSTPKTARSRRSIPLDPRTVAVLRRWRAQQAAERLALGLRAHASGLVFTKEDGSPVHPDHLDKRFKAVIRAAGVPRIRFHDLRRTWATLAFQAAVDAKVVQEILGHAHISITLNTYTHIIPAMKENATAIVDDLVHGQA